MLVQQTLSPFRSKDSFQVYNCHAPPPCARYCPLQVARRLSQSLLVSWEKASYTSREGTPYEPSSEHSLKRCGTLGTQCLTHTLRGEPFSALIPFIMPYPHVHDIVLFGLPEDSLSHSRFCSSHMTPSLIGKGLIHIKGGHPL